MLTNRHKAFFINGGAGRVLCSIPAFEKYLETDKDFIIVSECGTDFFKGHPDLHSRVFDNWHKNLFNSHLKDRDIISLEPYRVWEYYNQKCNLSQAFDIQISNKGIRDLNVPKIYLSKSEIAQGYSLVDEIKKQTGFDKCIVIQPFGRGVQNNKDYVIDPSSRSFHLSNIVDIINILKRKYAIIVMSEFSISLSDEKTVEYPVAMPQINDIRIWSSIIDACDHFVGCDSVGQHIARSFNKTATVCIGSTFPENISYPNNNDFDIIDLGYNKRTYSPIRLTVDDVPERLNDDTMEMNKDQINLLINSIQKFVSPSKRIKQVDQHTCCSK